MCRLRSASASGPRALLAGVRPPAGVLAARAVAARVVAWLLLGAAGLTQTIATNASDAPFGAGKGGGAAGMMWGLAAVGWTLQTPGSSPRCGL